MRKFLSATVVIAAVLAAAIPVVIGSANASACSFPVPDGAEDLTRQVYPQSSQPGNPNQLVTVTICSFTLNDTPMVLIRARYLNAAAAAAVVKALAEPEAFAYLGVPTAFYPDGDPSAGIFSGSVFSDDCGLFDEEHPEDAGTGCPSGSAALVGVGRDIYVLANRFELDSKQLTEAPVLDLDHLRTRVAASFGGSVI